MEPVITKSTYNYDTAKSWVASCCDLAVPYSLICWYGKKEEGGSRPLVRWWWELTVFPNDTPRETIIERLSASIKEKKDVAD